jgi:hypothetical protein
VLDVVESTGNVGVFRVSMGKKRTGRFPRTGAVFRVVSWGCVAPRQRVFKTGTFGHSVTPPCARRCVISAGS